MAIDSPDATNRAAGSQTALQDANHRNVLRTLLDRIPTHGTTKRADLGKTGLTQAELAKATGLSAPTVATAVNRFRSQGIVLPGLSPANGEEQKARPRFHINPAAGYAVSVQFGHRRVRAAACNLYGLDIEDARKNDMDDVDEEYNASLDSAAQLIRDVTDQMVDAGWVQPRLDPGGATVSREFLHHEFRENLLGVAISVGAPLNVDRTRISVNTIMPGWRGVKIDDAVRRRLGWATEYIVENDANLGMLAERRFGRRTETHGLYVKWSYGLGGGLLVDGRICAGGTGIAGEIGHLVPLSPPPSDVIPAKECARCGKNCLESYVAAPALARASGIDIRTTSIGDLITMAAENEAVRGVIRAAAYTLGSSLALYVTVMNPEVIVFGGAFDERARWALVQDRIRDGINDHALTHAAEDVHLVPGSSVLFGHASVHGGLARLLDPADVVDRLVARHPLSDST